MVRVAVDRDGDAVISFRSAAGAHPRVFARHWRRDGRLGRLLAVSPPAHENGFHHTLAGDLEGDAVVAWTRMLPDDRIELHGRHISRSGKLGPVTRFGRGDLPDATVDDDGDGVVAWHAPDDHVQTEARARSIRRSGSFGPARKLAPGGRVPQAGASPTGAVVAIWQLKDYPYRIQTAFQPVR